MDQGLAPSEQTRLRSVHTPSFPSLLAQAGVSLLVSTYQAGKLVVLRADGEQLNTHFRAFPMPMGLALSGARLALGTRWQVWEFENAPGAAAALEPAGKHDACYLPRACFYTGDVRIHEMAWVEGEPWFVNTRFSCLCTPSRRHSFEPRWRPRFISALAAEDRCHLNGLGLVEGRPRFATALGETDTPGGWRQDKARGGILIDVSSGETVARGLSMPHSPRWHAGKLWVLESGTGTLGVMDLASGRYEPVAFLPGFTRGLDFHGRFAFVGLSQVRETATFSGLPITEGLTERACGVWVVDVPTGRTVAILRFEDAVQEIFAVQVLPGCRFPDIITRDEKLLGDTFLLGGEAFAQCRVG